MQQLEHQGKNRQFSILQVPANYQGKAFSLLIDSGSTHSFISPRCLKKLILDQKEVSPMQVELASGKLLLTRYETEELASKFKVLPLGLYDGILGMDWLTRNQANIHCHKGTISFLDLNGNKVQGIGETGSPPLKLVKASQMLKGLRKNRLFM